MYVKRYDDGRLVLHDPDEHAQFSLELLRQADPNMGLTWEDGVITVAVSNGTWRWREVRQDDEQGVVHGVLIHDDEKARS